MAAEFFKYSKQKRRCFTFLFFNTKWIDKFSKTFLGIPKEFYNKKADDQYLNNAKNVCHICYKICLLLFFNIIICSKFFRDFYTILQQAALFSQEFLKQNSEYISLSV